MKALVFLIVAALLSIVGCFSTSKSPELPQNAKSRSVISKTSNTTADHLSEVYSLLSRFPELQSEQAIKQIVFHLNSWQKDFYVSGPVENMLPETRNMVVDSSVVDELLQSISRIKPLSESIIAVRERRFNNPDVEVLLSRYLSYTIASRIDSGEFSDSLVVSLLKNSYASLSSSQKDSLDRAAKLFDWTVRNIAIKPEIELGQKTFAPSPALPFGMTIEGLGYSQSLFETIFRGSGDWLQRTAVFLALCQQANLPACILKVSASKHKSMRYWVAGVLIGGEIYLFDCRLGMPILNAEQNGLATLAQAITDDRVLRRMNVPGLYNYPFQKQDIQHCSALLMLNPQAMSDRFCLLQKRLAGDLRVNLFDDPESLHKLFSSTQGLVSIGIWETPLLASLYAVKLAAVARDDTRLEIHTRRNWYHLDPERAGKNGLALGRWQHLLGKVNQPENCDELGAKKIYLSQRLPEYEIAQLRNDVSLQLQYGIRRDLGVTPSEYDSQIIKIQEIMRLGKLTATHWLGIIQFESSNFESAVDWLKICVSDNHESSALSSAARYNLARCYENLGDVSSAVELLRTKGDSQEHGNRIRSRLLLKQER
jgi:hypothetical protein